MTDVRRALAATALGMSLLLTGCGGESEPAVPEPTAAEPSADPVGGSACESIDAAALTAETGVTLAAPDIAGEPGQREACSISFGEGAVLRIDLLPGHGTLEQDVENVKVLGTEKPGDVTIAGQPGLLVSLSNAELVNVGLVTHVGDRLLQLSINNPDAGEDLHEQMKALALAVSEQVAAGAAG